MPLDGKTYKVKILTKELANPLQGTRLYDITTLELEKLASFGARTDASQALPALTSFHKQFATLADAVNGKGISVLRDEKGVPLVQDGLFHTTDGRTKSATDNTGTFTNSNLLHNAPPIEWDSFRQSIRDFVTQKLPTQKILNLGIIRIEGIPGLPVILRQGVLKKAASKGISPASLEDLPAQPADPIAVLASTNNPGNRRIILTELKTDDGPPNPRGRRNRSQVPTIRPSQSHPIYSSQGQPRPHLRLGAQ